jgi:hypothetical protein
MRKINPKSLENLKLSERRGLSKNFQIKVSESLKERLATVPPDVIRSWLQDKLDSFGGDTTVADELIERVQIGMLEELPELEDLVRRVGIGRAMAILNDTVRVGISEASEDSLNRALALVAAHRLALMLNEPD